LTSRVALYVFAKTERTFMRRLDVEVPFGIYFGFRISFFERLRREKSLKSDKI